MARILVANIAVCANAVAVPTVIGIMATLYMGGLMAASHNFPFDGGKLEVVVIKYLDRNNLYDMILKRGAIKGMDNIKDIPSISG